MAALAATADSARDRLYAGLMRRNRLVGLLRIVVPAAGALVLTVVLAGVILDNLREQFGFSSLSIDRDNLLVDIPTVTATGDDGTLYSATARTAKVRLGSMDMIDMVDAVFTMTAPEGASFTATAPGAALQVGRQTLTVPGTVTVTSNDGLSGTLTDFFGDMQNWQIVAHGAADITFPEGMHVEAQAMRYDGNLKLWSFERATVTLPETPGAAP